MARVVLLVLVLALVSCLLLVQDAEAKKKKPSKALANKKSLKRRLATIVHGLESNVSALWEEVKQLSQPVHVHLHGDGHVMGHDSHHDHHDHRYHDHDDHGDHDHKDHHHNDGGDDKGHKHHKHDGPKQPAGDKMMKKAKMMKEGGDHVEGGHGHMHGEGGDGGNHLDHGHGRSGTHVHIHLHTGSEDEEEGGSGHHHAHPPLSQEYRYARCDMKGNSAQSSWVRQITGTVFFRQMPNHLLEAKGSLRGITITQEEKRQKSQKKDHKHLRGLHAHEFGNMLQGCNSLGGHLNPHGLSHGGPGAGHRHVGDFGNIEVKDDGTAMTSFNDTVGSLFGFESILGRSLVLHAGADDEGHGHDAGSKKTGNAGARIACCAIVACPEPAGVWSKK